MGAKQAPLGEQGSEEEDEEDEESEEQAEEQAEEEGERVRRAFEAHALLHDLALCHLRMAPADQLAVLRLVLSAGGLPLCRDAPSYLAVVSVLHGGLGGQNAYMRAVLGHAMGAWPLVAGQQEGSRDGGGEGWVGL